jgi:hypothetical protein
MFVDALLLFSDAQAVTAAAGSTNTVNLGAANMDIGTGEPLYVVVVVDTTMDDSGDDSTITVAIEGDSTTTITPDATQDLFTIPAVTAAGSVFIARLDPAADPLQYQYLRLKYTPANGNLSAGAFTAFITNNIDRFDAKADNITIS